MARRGWGSIAARDGKFYGRFRLDGSPTMRLLLRPDGAPCATLRQAETALHALRKKVMAGDAEPKPAAARTFRAWAAETYLPAVSLRISATSLRSAGAHLERFAAWTERPDGGPRAMDKVTRKHADRFVRYLVHDEGCKPSYADRLVRTLRGAWRAAARDGVVEDSGVWNEVAIRVGPGDEVPWITPEQLVALYDAVTPSQRSLVVVLGETGLRVGEGLGLRWRDVDLDGAPSIFVREGKTRAARRKVPLSPRAAAAFGALVRGEPEALVFSLRTTQGVREAIRRACVATGVPRLKTHSLRHVAASHLVQAGVPAPTVARLLGHADHGVLVTRLYGRWMPADAEQAAMDRMAAWRAAASPAARPTSGGRSRAGRTTRGRPSVRAGRPAPATTAAGS